MKNTDEIKLNYTTIKHNPRMKYELSNNDYCIANAIYHLSNNPESKFKGWYYGRVEKLGQMFGLSKPTAYSSVNKLIDKNLVIKDDDTSFLKTSSIWYKEFVNDYLTASKEI